jgi:hypothetical protein
MKWEPGRQGGGYRKLRLLLGRNFDAYLIHYPKDTGVDWHRDPVPGKRHFRLNVLVYGQDRFFMQWKPIFRWGPFCLFRPDLCLHRVPPVDRPRLILSVGVAIS